MALADGGKIAGLPRNAVIAGAAALVIGVAYFWWRSRKGGKSGTADTSAATPSPAGDGTAGGMTDNFFITIQDQQETKPHAAPHPHEPGPYPPHRHPHHKRDHRPPRGQHFPAPVINWPSGQPSPTSNWPGGRQPPPGRPRIPVDRGPGGRGRR